ncbi:MAG: cell division protein FtsQ/DivIB [Pelagimonas sp.]|uniref:cell division protein FtsQ/DivIB n=1 Tax=Pelagimonas sp. TaxID=2073170 RepID=UPI003D6BDB55
MQPLNRNAKSANAKVARHDPAPSRLKYRMERLKLTPGFRFCMRVVLPCAMAFGAVSLWASSDDNRAAFNQMIADARETIESRPEFQVKLMAVDGASPKVAEQIRQALPVDFPISSFDLDLGKMHETVVAMHAVKSAQVRVRQGNVLQIEIEERVPAVLRRGDRGLELLDETGALVGPTKTRANHVMLPVIAGDGAHDAVPEALALYKVTGPLRSRLRGFERMGARRWDVVLDQGQRILLPEANPVRALERTIAMDQAIQMLARDLVVVDLRLPRRPTIRMGQDATQAMWAAHTINAAGE